MQNHGTPPHPEDATPAILAALQLMVTALLLHSPHAAADVKRILGVIDEITLPSSLSELQREALKGLLAQVLSELETARARLPPPEENCP